MSLIKVGRYLINPDNIAYIDLSARESDYRENPTYKPAFDIYFNCADQGGYFNSLRLTGNEFIEFGIEFYMHNVAWQGTLENESR